MTAGEAADPQATIPRAVNNLIWRILFFYVGALLFIMMFVAWTSVGLTASPFVACFPGCLHPGGARERPQNNNGRDLLDGGRQRSKGHLYGGALTCQRPTVAPCRLNAPFRPTGPDSPEPKAAP